ncbi:RagB/SusD family nutrient uptake outer membrane protein [Zobellia laminariae]|uniref:RagB/SusD family nutrient uptake outer membrane protein n=1 Tax=Zobellia laminariae TaxID=248906 RepID=UPI0012D9151F|nr:RagB/SusD family nutrient uptake outer membrane protein [Zobellia laminariae]
MKFLKNITDAQRPTYSTLYDPIKLLLQRAVCVAMTMILFGCTTFVEVDPPKNTLVSETVFNNAATVESALANLYFDIREQGMVSGTTGLTPVLGIYSDELDYYGFNTDLPQFYRHDLLASNGITTNWWSQAYHTIYGANDIIRGVEASEVLSIDNRKKFRGQALFIRAYMHSLLVSIFGDVPYIESTDYLENNKVSRMAAEEVYGNIIADLNRAIDDMEGLEPTSDERVLPDHFVAKALLARMYLYVENWDMAISLSSELIDHFSLEDDIDNVFLKDSRETLWQLKADAQYPLNTREAEQLIIRSIPGQTYALTEDLLVVFEANDLRKDRWVGSVSDTENTTTLFFANKYRAGINETESLEYSIIFRLSEQVLIRAEGRARLGEITRSRADLNAIRNRSGLPDNTGDTAGELLDDIIRERRIELFTEQGLRWFDLKRTDMADQVLGALKPNWQPTDVLFPIPESELEANPNLLPQNGGY